MTNLLKLQFRKSLLTFGVIAAALLLSAPLALLIKPAAMKAADAVNLAMAYWALAGIPLTALILAGIAGADAAGELAAAAEQPLPVPQYKLLLSSLFVALLETMALMAAAWAIMGFALPLEDLTAAQEYTYRLYAFSFVYLSLYAFLLSYAFRNGIAGALLSCSAAAATVLPLISIGVFQKELFELIPLRLVIPAIALLVLAAGLLALKRFSEISDRKVKRTAAGMSAVALLLAAPALSSLAALGWLDLEARKVTLPVSYMFAPMYGPDKYLGSARARELDSSLMLVQKPFYGEVFLIDKEGNRAIINPGGQAGTLEGFPYFLPGPDLSIFAGEIATDHITGPDGVTWVFYMRRDKGVILSGNMKTGLTERAQVSDAWSMHLLGGKEPGLLHQRSDGDYFAALPPGKGGLKWKKISSLDDGYLDFLGKKAYREGIVAVFRDDGKTLEYRGQRWTIPGPLRNNVPAVGVELADGMNFIVPGVKGDQYVSWLCSPDGKTRIIWRELFQTGRNLRVTPDGAVWGVKRDITAAPGGKNIKYMKQEFYVLTPEGKAFSGIGPDGILPLVGYVDDALTPLRARDGWLWFSAADKYMVKVEAENPSNSKAWRLPKGVKEKVNLVSPSKDGVFITGIDGVYFMDWDGVSRKIY